MNHAFWSPGEGRRGKRIKRISSFGKAGRAPRSRSRLIEPPLQPSRGVEKDSQLLKETNPSEKKEEEKKKEKKD